MDPAESLGALLLRQAETRPDAPFVHGERSWSYGEFAQEALAVAGGLRELGLRRGDVLGVWSPNSREFLLAWFGAALAGVVLNPINPQYTADEAGYILDDSGARALAHAGVDAGAVEAVGARCRALETTIPLADGPAPSVADLARGEPASPEAVRAEDLASLIYTSGTTGRPKGVMLEHGSYVWDAGAYAEVVPFGPGEAALTVLPLFHVNAQLVTTIVPLVVGGATIVAPRFSVREFWPTVERFEPVFVSVVPTILTMLLETADELSVPERTSLRAVVVGAAPLPTDLFRRFEERFGLHLIEGYGLSESTCVASANPYYGPRKIGSIGLALRGQEMRVVDDSGAPVPVGEPGEIVLSGPNVMRGYWRNEEATAEALRGGWLRTGDVARVDEDGYFFIVDRKKDMIIRGGENIYPREIEEVLHDHPGVTHAAVVGVPDDVRGEEVMAVIVRRDASLTEEAVADWLEERVAPYKRPRFVEFVEEAELPRTPTGKVRKGPLREAMRTRLEASGAGATERVGKS